MISIRKNNNRASSLLLALLLIPFLASCCFGQLATVQGEVRDPSNAVVPGTAVKVTNSRTGVSQATSSNQSGYYSVPGLIPGSYTVEAEAKGFQKAVSKNLTLDVNQVARIDFSLQPGLLTQTINVSSEAAALNTETSTVGQVINNQTSCYGVAPDCGASRPCPPVIALVGRGDRVSNPHEDRWDQL